MVIYSAFTQNAPLHRVIRLSSSHSSLSSNVCWNADAPAALRVPQEITKTIRDVPQSLRLFVLQLRARLLSDEGFVCTFLLKESRV